MIHTTPWTERELLPGRTPAEVEAMVTGNIRLVDWFFSKHIRYLKRLIKLTGGIDIIKAELLLGLYDAARSYDASRRIKFSSHFHWQARARTAAMWSAASRKKQVRLKVNIEDVPPRLLAAKSSDDTTSEKIEEMHRQIKQLRAREREIMTLRLRGLKNRDIAKQLGISYTYAREFAARAKRELRERMADAKDPNEEASVRPEAKAAPPVQPCVMAHGGGCAPGTVSSMRPLPHQGQTHAGDMRGSQDAT